MRVVEGVPLIQKTENLPHLDHPPLQRLLEAIGQGEYAVLEAEPGVNVLLYVRLLVDLESQLFFHRAEPPCVAIREVDDALEVDDAFTVESIEATTRALAEEQGAGFGRIIHPARLAATGTTAGVGMVETLISIGRDETIQRLRRAAVTLG